MVFMSLSFGGLQCGSKLLHKILIRNCLEELLACILRDLFVEECDCVEICAREFVLFLVEVVLLVVEFILFFRFLFFFHVLDLGGGCTLGHCRQ